MKRYENKFESLDYDLQFKFNQLFTICSTVDLLLSNTTSVPNNLTSLVHNSLPAMILNAVNRDILSMKKPNLDQMIWCYQYARAIIIDNSPKYIILLNQILDVLDNNL